MSGQSVHDHILPVNPMLRRVSVIALLLLLAFSAYIHYYAGFVGDKQWMLLAAHMMLGGKKLYADIFEVQPPLIFWLYTVPVAIAQHFSIKDHVGLVVMGFSAVGLCMYVCVRISAFHPRFAQDKQRQCELVLLLACVLVLWTNVAYFADREHLFLTLTFPYILRWMPSLARYSLPLRLRIVIGCMAALGFCIKPHCLIVFAGVQAFTLWRERRPGVLLSAENCIIYVACIAYITAAWLLYPDYFTLILPMAFATYSGYQCRLCRGGFFLMALFTAAMTFVDFSWRRTSPYRRDIYYFLGVAGLLALYALFNNGWGYTFNPLCGMLLFTTGWVLWECRYLRATSEQPDRKLSFGVRDCFINFTVNTFIMLQMYYGVFTAECGEHTRCQMIDQLTQLAEREHIRSFAPLGASFEPWPPLARATHTELGTRFYSLWMLPKLFSAHTQDAPENRWVVDYVARALAQDMERNKPDFMIVDVSPEFYRTRERVDLLAFFNTWPAFAAAWSHYTFLQNVEYCEDTQKAPWLANVACSYDVYKRVK